MTTTSAEEGDVQVAVSREQVMTLLCRHTGTGIDSCTAVAPDTHFELEVTSQGTYHVRWRFNKSAIELISIVTEDSSGHIDRLVLAAFAELAKQAQLRLIVVRVLPERARYWQKLGFTSCTTPPGSYEIVL